jgi:hypothetical protein
MLIIMTNHATDVLIIIPKKKDQSALGITYDGHVIEKYVHKNIKIHYGYKDTFHEHKNNKYDIMIHIEHIIPQYLKVGASANIYVPNIEMLLEYDISNIHKMDYIMCKNIFSFDKFNNYDKIEGITRYTSFTSLFETNVDHDTDYNLVGFFAGTSYLKNAKLVIESWIDNNYFKNINPNVKLIITKKIIHPTATEKELKHYLDKIDFFREPIKKFYNKDVSGYKYDNIYYFEYLNAEDYNYFFRKAFLHLCPSMIEGFGHYINEARMMKKIILTTNEQPMNELISHNEQLVLSGSKIDISKIIYNKYHVNEFSISAHYIDKVNFINKLELLLQLDVSTIKKIGEQNYEKYVNDKHFFVKELNNIIKECMSGIKRDNKKIKVTDLNKYEKKVYSQNGEDGIIEKIFDIIGSTNRYYVEFGVEDAKECNTRLLRQKGWNGLMLDGGYENKKINLRKHFISAENICYLFAKYGVNKHFDLLSVDIDYNDFYVLHEILKSYVPRVIICEYNGFFEYNEDKVVIYDPKNMWDKTKYYGASFMALNNLLEKYGYKVICTDLNGVNLFAIKKDLMNKFHNYKSLKDIYHKIYTDRWHKDDYLDRKYLSSKEAENDTSYNVMIKDRTIELFKNDARYDEFKKYHKEKNWKMVDKLRDKMYKSISKELGEKYSEIVDCIIKNTIK